MLVRVASLYHWLQRWWLYASLSILTIGIVALGQPQLVRAAEWWQILIQGAQIIQLSNVSDAQEASLGAETNRSILNQVKLYRNPAVGSYIDSIGQRLARNSGRPNIRYTFQVVEDNAINAFATMGGYVYINTGTIKAADNEAQLAGVIGHEIGHIAGKHSLQRVRQSAIAQGISSVAGVDRDRIVQMGVQVALTLPNSRQDEYDADRRGLTMLMQTGYAPSGLPEFMRKLANSNSAPEFLSSHPAAGERATRLQNMIPAAYRNRTEGLNASVYKQNLRNFF
ncbi:M48 family metallopeptidase [Chamaesiphon minutus]|uniref:Peptidase family M48 n=1 Tax=Chamaesiphon minutus (strain ATCC 27169 / PCC 6605) TaxID=1173020 RepID=K9UFS9_CHAP6|nr:M48 family metallopeptidase [Chamaesiphon minutus]AFY93967.1 Peptidase family M48 [Chamaesiphon minutus PCC 6605]